MAVAWHCACSLIWRRCSLSWLYGTESYSYDSLYRLTGVTYTDGITQTYTYDSTGNRTAKIEAGSTITYTYDAADRLTYANTDSYSFDANGNLKQRVSGTITATYCYDALDRLIVSTNQSSCPTLPVRVNAGGALYNDSNGDDWAADMGFSGGNAYYFSAAIAGTIDDTLYQYVRSGATNFSYAIGLPSGNYTVTLKFAETYYNSAGQRVFDVLAEGVTVIDNLDVYAAAGGKNVAYDRTFVATVTDGTLNLGFAGVTSTAMVSAVEVLPVPAALPVSYSYRADGLRSSKTISGSVPITYTWDINAGLPVTVMVSDPWDFNTENGVSYVDAAVIGVGRDYWNLARMAMLLRLRAPLRLQGKTYTCFIAPARHEDNDLSSVGTGLEVHCALVAIRRRAPRVVERASRSRLVLQH